MSFAAPRDPPARRSTSEGMREGERERKRKTRDERKRFSRRRCFCFFSLFLPTFFFPLFLFPSFFSSLFLHLEARAQRAAAAVGLLFQNKPPTLIAKSGSKRKTKERKPFQRFSSSFEPFFPPPFLHKKRKIRKRKGDPEPPTALPRTEQPSLAQRAGFIPPSRVSKLLSIEVFFGTGLCDGGAVARAFPLGDREYTLSLRLL